MSHYQYSSPPSLFQRSFKYLAGLVLLAIALMAAFHFFVAEQMSSPIDKLAKAIGAVTERKVNVKGHTLTLESSETRELVVIKRRTQSVVKYESRWLGSDKLVIVQGTFVIKAGYDLSEFEGFEVKGNEVIGEWPEPRVLSVDLQDYEVFFSKSGVVNKIQEADYEKVSNLLIQQARRDAIINSNILEEADRIIETRIQDLTDGEYKLTREPKKS